MPPLRSSPRNVFRAAITTPETAIRPATSSRMNALRRRSDIDYVRMLVRGRDGRGMRGRSMVAGRENNEDPAFLVVIGRKDVGHRPRGKIALGVDLDRLALHADLPFKRSPDVIGPVVE